MVEFYLTACHQLQYPYLACLCNYRQFVFIKQCATDYLVNRSLLKSSLYYSLELCQNIISNFIFRCYYHSACLFETTNYSWKWEIQDTAGSLDVHISPSHLITDVEGSRILNHLRAAAPRFRNITVCFALVWQRFKEFCNLSWRSHFFH